MDTTKLRKWIEFFNEDALLADGFEEAVMGMAERCGQPSLVLYDIDKCIKILMERDKMTREEAYDYFNFNVAGAWMGENTPMFFVPLDLC